MAESVPGRVAGRPPAGLRGLRILSATKADRQTRAMELTDNQQRLLRRLPGVDQLLEQFLDHRQTADIPHGIIVGCIRKVLETLRSRILTSGPTVREQDLVQGHILEMVAAAVQKAMTPNLGRLVNATGVVVHTNLGRSPLPPVVMENIAAVARGYSNLEYDLTAGKRGSRYSAVEDILCEISGAPAAMVVNNNAGAVLLCLETLARNRNVVVSRGELVEIGGSFRIPDVMAKSGAILKEIGTTNRTHLRDYENAIDAQCALLLKVHRSNFSIVGFTTEVSLGRLAELGSRRGVPVMEDLGSGTFVDLSKYGLVKEPTVQESVAAGADLVTFSGDKLLGGPQAGLIVGQKALVDRIKQNPLARALRIDKLTLAALETTLRLYYDEHRAVDTLPTLRMLTADRSALERRAAALMKALAETGGTRLQIQIAALGSKAGGGALPLLDLPSSCLKIQVSGISANQLEKNLRANDPPVIGRIEDDAFIMDPRTLFDEDLPVIQKAFERLLNRVAP